MMVNSIALSTPVHDELRRHLLRTDGQEDLAFALWHPSQGETRLTALITEAILPKSRERLVHGNVSFLPEYFERVVGLAVKARSGIAFLHSHLGPGWQGMSNADIAAELRLAPSVKGATGLLLVGMTLGTDGAWSGRLWHKTGPRKYERRWCRSVRVVGDSFQVTFDDSQAPQPTFREELTRTTTAWGPAIQAHLARLRIGVIGAGSVGSIVAEALAKMGIGTVLLLDFDAVERLNLDRILHASHQSIGRAKVQVLAEAIRRSATAANFTAAPMEYSIVEPEGFSAALDCDLLFSCVDRPWPRSVLNFIAYAHLIPVVDGGIVIHMRPHSRGLRGADWKAHIACPTRRCLECLGQYDSGLVSTERDGYFDNPSYFKSLPEDHPIRRNENVFCFSLAAASLEVLQLISMIVRPAGISNTGALTQHFVTASIDKDHAQCGAKCFFRSVVAKGDHADICVTGRHASAELARLARSRHAKPGIMRRLWRRLRGID